MFHELSSLLALHPLLEGLLPGIRGNQEAPLGHVHHLSLRVASISLNKGVQKSFDSCSDESTFNDLVLGSVLGRRVRRIDGRLP